MGKLRVYWLKTLKKLSIYPLGNTPSAPSVTQEAIPLMPRSSGLGWASREMGAAFVMAGASYLPWLAGSLEEHPGEGYWLSFNQRLPISYELGDRLFGLLHWGRLVRDKEDAEGEIAEDAVEEEII